MFGLRRTAGQQPRDARGRYATTHCPICAERPDRISYCR